MLYTYRIVIQYLQVHCIIYRGKKIQSVFSGKKSAEKYHFCKVPAKVSGQFHAINMYRSIRKKNKHMKIIQLLCWNFVCLYVPSYDEQEINRHLAIFL
jgi:hypothetical protein